MWQTAFAISVENNIVDLLGNFAIKSIAQAARVIIAFVIFSPRQFRGRAERDDIRYRFRAGPPFPLLMPADLLRDQPYSSTNVERARPFRRIKFMRGKGKQIATEGLNVNRN